MNKEFNFSVTIIGAGSAMPAHNHISACQVVRYGKHYYQIDCSDGTFTRMIELGIPYQNIDAIFISHNHGDHINGLIECIEGFSLGGRTKPLKIFSPVGLEKLYKPMLDEFCTDLRYKFEFIELNSEEQKVIWEDNCLTVETIPLLHTVSCCGYLFKENKKLPHIDIDKINKFRIPVKFINSIKNGMDWIDKDGTIIKSEELTIPPDKPHSYAYCSDTAYFPELSNIIKNANLVLTPLRRILLQARRCISGRPSTRLLAEARKRRACLWTKSQTRSSRPLWTALYRKRCKTARRRRHTRIEDSRRILRLSLCFFRLRAKRNIL